MKNKNVKVQAIVGSQRCMVKMIDFYLSKLPEDPKAFYLRPCKHCPDDGTAWYVNVPVGVNTLKSMLPNMSKMPVPVHIIRIIFYVPHPQLVFLNLVSKKRLFKKKQATILLLV